MAEGKRRGNDAVSGACPVCGEKHADLLQHIKQRHPYEQLSGFQKQAIMKLIERAMEQWHRA